MNSPPPPTANLSPSSNHIQISIRADPSSPSSSPSLKQTSWVRPTAPLISLNPRHPPTSALLEQQQPGPSAKRDSATGSWLSDMTDLGRRLGGQRRRSSSPRRSSGAQADDGWTSARVLDLATSWRDALWLPEPSSHPHRADDSPRMTSPRPFPNLRASLARPRDYLQLSRAGYLAVVVLLLLGLAELVSYSTPSSTSSAKVGIRGKDPFDVLNTFAPKRTRSSGALAAQDRLWMTASEKQLDEVDGDVTAVVLHWKRTENVVVIVASLCQYSFFNTILIWNNNPDVHLTRETLAAASCPASRLRIYNSPRNMFFLARYLACASASTPHCFFQDDDWLVRPLRSLYSQFSRDPEGPVVVHTSSDVATLYSLEWCFFQPPLHTCFSWVGTGAFVAKSHVKAFLATVSHVPYPREELGHADNSFTLFQNEPPYVLSSELAQLPAPFGHSDGDGLARNKRYIQQGLVHLTAYLGSTSGTDLSSPIFALPLRPLTIDTSAFVAPPLPPLPPHPYAHHARSPCADDACVFLTNIALLPPPDAAPYPGPSRVSLEEWENHLGWVARGWIEGKELFNDEETWATGWPYAAAVDGRPETAFRSPDVMRRGDYIGLGLLAPVDPHWIPRLTLHFVLEDVKLVSHFLAAEVSLNGYYWVDPLPSTPGGPIPSPTCRTTSHTSTAPDLSFPSSYLSSPSARAIRSAEQAAESSRIGTWWRRRRRRATRLVECSLVLETALDQGDGAGWKFVRLKAGGEAKVGWGVYQIWVD